MLSPLLLTMSGCAVACIEDSSGTKCSAKSLEQFMGPAQAPQLLDRAPGSPVTIDVLYGSVLVERSASGKVEVLFQPFVYAGHDEKASADAQLAQNLRTNVTAAPGAIAVSVRREGGTNGLGADVTVRLPDNFDGALTIINHGDGPVNNFEVIVNAVGQATAINVTNGSLLGDCLIQGAPSVRSSSVSCGEKIALLDVSDEVNITNSEEMYDDPAPAVALRIAGVTPNSRGGKVTTASGAIQATFPAAGGYVINARSPVRGAVQEGGLPANCKAAGAGNAKTVTCGQGPTYELTAGAAPDYVGEPKDSNVLLSYR
jgi:hypothetical protein